MAFATLAAIVAPWLRRSLPLFLPLLVCLWAHAADPVLAHPEQVGALEAGQFASIGQETEYLLVTMPPRPGRQSGWGHRIPEP